MGFFKHKSKRIPYQQLIVKIEKGKGELAKIVSKKQRLERRLEILTRAKPSNTIIINSDVEYTPTSEIESEISYISTRLSLLDQEEDATRDILDIYERDRRDRDRIEALEPLIKVKISNGGKI